MNIKTIINDYFLHFNAGETKHALIELKNQINKGNKIFITLAGAMSTARIGKLLAPAIEKGLIGAVCCTGANLEEDIFNAVDGAKYKRVNWRNLSGEEEEVLAAEGWNRVTDVCIPETVMNNIWTLLIKSWNGAPGNSPYYHMCNALKALQATNADIPRLSESWVAACSKHNVPVFVPGWSDSTTGNMFTVSVKEGEVTQKYSAVMSDAEQFALLGQWYEAHVYATGYGPAFLQIGGGIAGDWPICVVPSLRQDENKKVPHWDYFCQIGDAPASYGGYSGAPPNEKITWDKVSHKTPKFAIQSDASIVLPLMLAYLLE